MKKFLVIIVLLPFFLHLQAPPVDISIINNRYERWLSEEKIKSEYERFIKDLGYRESRNNPQEINSIGCFGEYQFKESTLKWLGYDITLRAFKKNPDIFPSYLQREAVDKLIGLNWDLLIEYHSLVGQEIKGIDISKSGLLAAAHLGGAGSVKLFLQSNGTINRKDINGTRISDYLEEFYGYEF